MARSVRLVVVCEDILHETFMRAFLYRRGFTHRDLTFRKPSAGDGDAKQRVCETLCKETEAVRKFSAPGRGVVYVIDADNLSVEARRRWVEARCRELAGKPPGEGDPVFGVIPKWEIENWLAYLRGEDVDEKSNQYDKYRHCESKIYPLVEGLADKCARQEDLPDAPPSLTEACIIYGKFSRWKKGF